jgi:hypothetical protein
MCFKPDIPEPKQLPRTPTIDDDAVRQRERQEEALLRARSGRQSTFVSDLSPSQVVGQRRVLLGQ